MTQDRFIGKKFDEYRVESLLGKGNMAAIYLGVDDRLRRKAAIKMIGLDLQGEAEYVMRFEREARAIAQLSHPHIVQLYRYGEAEGMLYMAMQYIEGASLAIVLQSYKEDGEYIEADEAARIIREIGGALDYAHEQGVIHRDVKPANIMLNIKGTAILTDFGLVLLKSDGTRGGVLGTPHYLAPEQALSSANATAQSDLYSLGVVLYEMLTNIRPFEAKKPIEVAMLHITKQPRSPREHRPELSPQVEAVVLKAMSKKPEDRYRSGAEFSAALDEALRTGGIGPARAGAPRPAPVGTILSRTLVIPLSEALKARPGSGGTDSSNLADIPGASDIKNAGDTGDVGDIAPGPDADLLEKW